ncbi:hypothetical protein H920_08581 [Fukomys damarensis]|uniref:Uncharacterized protein n=1 Tax=Fukomys damarensis TaxID=885580 RepID=A0A091DHJ2_FUKDA|nr:hypothetical protein H920_08581 [Fukomys damarensis]
MICRGEVTQQVEDRRTGKVDAAGEIRAIGRKESVETSSGAGDNHFMQTLAELERLDCPSTPRSWAKAKPRVFMGTARLVYCSKRYTELTDAVEERPCATSTLTSHFEEREF